MYLIGLLLGFGEVGELFLELSVEIEKFSVLDGLVLVLALASARSVIVDGFQGGRGANILFVIHNLKSVYNDSYLY